MVDQQKIVVATTLLFSFYALAFGRFFPFWINRTSGEKWYETEAGTRLPKRRGWRPKRFYRGHKCLRERKRVATYQVPRNWVVPSLKLKREWKMFATKKVMKQRKSQGFLLLSGNSSNPFGNSRKKRIRDNYLQYLRRVHLLAKRFSSKRMAKNQVQNSSNPKEKNWGKWEVSEARRTECAKLNPTKPK